MIRFLRTSYRQINLPLLCLLYFVSRISLYEDCSSDNYNELETFENKIVNIYLSSASNYYLTVNSMTDKVLFVNKYSKIDTSKYNNKIVLSKIDGGSYKFMVKLSSEEDKEEKTPQYELYITHNIEKNYLSACRDCTPTIFRLVKRNLGFEISANHLCATKTLSNYVKMMECAGTSDQLFNFRFVTTEINNKRDKDINDDDKFLRNTNIYIYNGKNKNTSEYKPKDREIDRGNVYTISDDDKTDKSHKHNKHNKKNKKIKKNNKIYIGKEEDFNSHNINTNDIESSDAKIFYCDDCQEDIYIIESSLSGINNLEGSLCGEEHLVNCDECYNG